MAKVPVIDISGKKISSIEVADALVSAAPNPSLVAQAVKVYLANQRQARPQIQAKKDSAFTTAKMYRQKGTGKARHGSKKAAQFKGGKKAHGPVSTTHYSLTLPKRMKHQVIAQAMTNHFQNDSLKVVDSLVKADPKTKSTKTLLKNIAQYPDVKKVIIVLDSVQKEFIRSTKNLPGVKVTQASRLNYYELLDSHTVICTKPALTSIETLIVTGSRKPTTVNQETHL